MHHKVQLSLSIHLVTSNFASTACGKTFVERSNGKNSKNLNQQYE